MTTNRIKAALYWLIIAVGFLVHSILELSGLTYGKNIKLPDANGTVPLAVHIFLILFLIGTILLAVLTLETAKKGFKWFSFIWSLLFFLLNGAHLATTLLKERDDLSQIALLLLILTVNILLVISLRKWIKDSPAA